MRGCTTERRGCQWYLSESMYCCTCEEGFNHRDEGVNHWEEGVNHLFHGLLRL